MASLNRPFLSAVGYSCVTVSLLTLLAALSLLTNLYLGEIGEDLNQNYGVVMDAGSVHTTTSVYAWPTVRVNTTGRVKEVFSCEGSADSGVSSYAAKPEKVGEGLEAGGCLKKALEKVPRAMRPSSVLFMGGTAGMRVLNATNATSAGRIIDYADEFLQKHGFRPGKTAGIMQSSEEGIMGWITVNYLNGTFDEGKEDEGKVRTKSVGALDWGGASSQITFEVPNGGRHRKVTLFEKDYSVFTASHLCYGQKEALRRHFVEQVYLEWVKSEDKARLPTSVSSPCLPRKDSVDSAPYSLPASELFFSVCTRRSDENFQSLVESNPDFVFSFVGTSNLTACDAEVAKAFDLDHCRKSYKVQHCFNNNYIPRTDGKTTFLAFSTYWYLVTALQIPPGTIRESDFEEAINKLCRSSLGYAHGLLGRQGVEVEHTSCFKGLFMHRLLRDGYRLSGWTNIDFVKRVAGAEVGWTLGWILEATNALPEVVVIGGNQVILLIVIILLLCSSLGPVVYCCCKIFGPRRRGLSRRNGAAVDLSRYHYIEDFRSKSG